MTARPTLARRTLETLALFATRSGHLAQRVSQEHRGNCLPPGRCTPQCDQFREVLLEVIDMIEAEDAAQPAQLALIGEGAG